jgi:hypothetical protein
LQEDQSSARFLFYADRLLQISEEKIIPNNILDIIPDVIPEEYVDMVEYFVGLSGRTE